MERQDRSGCNEFRLQQRMTCLWLIRPVWHSPVWRFKRMWSKSYELTRRHNLCLVVTDGSAVLGLGDIGPEAGMPVMEGKCVLFKAFGDVDAFPLCIKSQ